MGKRQDDTPRYTEDQIRAVCDEIGIDVRQDDYAHLYAYCPYHANSDTPSFAINKTIGVWQCFNPSCGATGIFPKLVEDVGELSPWQALRLMARHKQPVDIQRVVANLLDSQQLDYFSQETLDKLHSNLEQSQTARDYWISRGLYNHTQDYFYLGYDPYRNMVTTPVHDFKGNPLGIVGRSIEGKQFKNSKGLPKSKTLFNIHRAKRAGEHVIWCESSLDAMLIHQAGYPCVVAGLGSGISDVHRELINRHFTGITIMTDMDKPQYNENCRKCEGECQGHNPGRALGQKIADIFKSKRVRWAMYEDGKPYPDGKKDAGDCTAQEIRRSIDNAVTKIEYQQQQKLYPILRNI